MNNLNINKFVVKVTAKTTHMDGASTFSGFEGVEVPDGDPIESR